MGTLFLMVGVVVTPGDIQDRDVIAPLLKVVRRMFPSLARAIAHGGYQGKATADDVRAEANMLDADQNALLKLLDR
jgi:hypothetical protein